MVLSRVKWRAFHPARGWMFGLSLILIWIDAVGRLKSAPAEPFSGVDVGRSRGHREQDASDADRHERVDLE